MEAAALALGFGVGGTIGFNYRDAPVSPRPLPAGPPVYSKELPAALRSPRSSGPGLSRRAKAACLGPQGICCGVGLLCDFRMSHLASLGFPSSNWPPSAGGGKVKSASMHSCWGTLGKRQRLPASPSACPCPQTRLWLYWEKLELRACLRGGEPVSDPDLSPRSSAGCRWTLPC